MAVKKPSVLKRERERARDEKAARKRESKARRQSGDPNGAGPGPRVATRDELGGYGLERRTSGDPFDEGSR
jgi:hypothetical protein